MSKEEAREYLLSLSYQFGTMGVEYLTDKDGLKMREAVELLERPDQSEPCGVCEYLEDEGTLYQISDWDGGTGFVYIRGIHFCPKCGRRL